MSRKVYYIILEDAILLSKREYNNWREIQDEYYDNFKTCMGPWTFEELMSYLECDYKSENEWPFIKDNMIRFFESNEIIHYSDN